VEAAAGVRQDASSTQGVTDAHGFVVQGSTAPDGQARRVVLMRRARFLFVIGMDARPPARSDAATLRELVLAQGWTLGQDAAWRPAGRVSGTDLAESYLMYLVFAVLLARGLLAVDDLLADRQARWRRRIALLKRAASKSTGSSVARSPSDQPPAVADGSVGVTVIDVTATARGRRDAARAVWLCGAFALLMLLPLADLSSFPGSLAVLASAVPTAAVAIGLQRRSRVAASLLLVVLAIASPGLALLLLIATVGSRQQPGVAAVALVTASIVAAIILVMAMGAVSVLWIPDGKGGAGESRTWSATTGTRRPVMGRRRRTVALVVALAVVVVVVVLTGLLLGGVGRPSRPGKSA